MQHQKGAVLEVIAGIKLLSSGTAADEIEEKKVDTNTIIVRNAKLNFFKVSPPCM